PETAHSASRGGPASAWRSGLPRQCQYVAWVLLTGSSDSQRSSPGRADCAVLSIHQHTWIHDPRGVQRSPRRPVRLGKEWRPLLVVPRPVVATDRVVVGDRPASGEQGFRGGGLDFGPLVELGSGAALGEDRGVGRWTIGIQV